MVDIMRILIAQRISADISCFDEIVCSLSDFLLFQFDGLVARICI